MGYTTDFEGKFYFDRPLAENHRKYLKAFAETRRMKRDPEKAILFPDLIRESVGLPIGEDGCYFIGGSGCRGQNNDNSVVSYDNAPGQPAYNGDFSSYWEERKLRIKQGLCQPGLWCQWVPTEDGTALVWDGGEKFYEYVAWLKYLMDHFIKPWGYKLNGTITWQGEDPSDTGIIRIDDNVIEVEEASKDA